MKYKDHFLKLNLIALIICFFSLNAMAQGLYQTSGKVGWLMVTEVGNRHGSGRHGHNIIKANVIIKFKNNPNAAYGFELANDKNNFSGNGMLNLLRDAFKNDYKVTIDYELPRRMGRIANKNGIITLVAIDKMGK